MTDIIERLRDDGSVLCDEAADYIIELRKKWEELIDAKYEIERLREALIKIRDHWANQYDHPRKQAPMYEGMYGIGVTDGHRAAAQIARVALGADRKVEASSAAATAVR